METYLNPEIESPKRREPGALGNEISFKSGRDLRRPQSFQAWRALVQQRTVRPSTASSIVAQPGRDGIGSLGCPPTTARRTSVLSARKRSAPSWSAVDGLRMRPDRIRHRAFEVLRCVDVLELEVLLGLEQQLRQHP